MRGATRRQLASAPARPTQREVLLDEAARQFNARGIAATSVNQVAKRVGLTRAAVYYYVKDSEDLVFQCYLRACQLTADDLAHAHEHGKDDLERIKEFVRRALAPERPQAAVVSEIAYLSDAKRAIIEAEHGRNIAALESFVRSGIRAGNDPRLRCARDGAGHLRHRQLDRAVARLGRPRRRCRVRAAHGGGGRRSSRARARTLARGAVSAAGST